MKTICCALGIVFASLCTTVQAAPYKIDYYLEVDLNGTWWLGAKTDAPGGIAIFVVKIVNAETGTSVAPRSQFGGSPVKGFAVGNLFHEYTNPPVHKEAFAGQNNTSPPSLVYGIGYQDVPDAAFGPLLPGVIEMVGSGIRNADGYVKLYQGTFSVGGILPAYAPNPSAYVGTVFSAPGVSMPIIGPNEGLTYTYEYKIVPEPSALLIAAVVVPMAALIFCRRKRSLSIDRIA